ncbi:MAG TPA: lysozyme inhibitor LprI family protein [Arenimonas sp.]
MFPSFMMALGLAAGPVVAPCDLPADACEAQAAFEAADVRLQATLDAIRARIEARGFADYMVGPEEISGSLEAGQAAWVNYRGAHCASVFRLMSGGTSRHVDELECLAQVTRARIAQLENLYGVAPD